MWIQRRCIKRNQDVQKKTLNQMKINNNKKGKGVVGIIIVAAVMLIVAMFHLPIGYYIFLRIFVFATSVIWIFQNLSDGLSFSNIVTAIIGILFNPVFPVYLHSKGTWSVIDFISALWFIFLLVCMLRNRKKIVNKMLYE